jgi:hypothetical protein
MPERIQLSRRKGHRKPPGAIVVARPSRWGNPYRLYPGLRNLLVDQWGNEYSCAPGEWRGVAVRKFREDLVDGRLPYNQDDVVRELRGHDLACWCAPSFPCHADVLLDIAANWEVDDDGDD